MNTSRRSFLASGLGLGTVLVLPRQAAAETPHLDESDPAARAVSYVHDASKVDKARFPAYAQGQDCGSCSLYQGDAGAAWGGCVLFGDKQVAARGWCSAYTNM